MSDVSHPMATCLSLFLNQDGWFYLIVASVPIAAAFGVFLVRLRVTGASIILALIIPWVFAILDELFGLCFGGLGRGFVLVCLLVCVYFFLRHCGNNETAITNSHFVRWARAMKRSRRSKN